MRQKSEKKAVQADSTEKVQEIRTFNNDEVFTRAEAARFLRCGISTLPKLPLPVLARGRSRRYLRRDLEKYLLSIRQEGSSE